MRLNVFTTHTHTHNDTTDMEPYQNTKLNHSIWTDSFDFYSSVVLCVRWCNAFFCFCFGFTFGFTSRKSCKLKMNSERRRMTKGKRCRKANTVDDWNILDGVTKIALHTHTFAVGFVRCVFGAFEISHRVWILCILKPRTVHVIRRPDEISNRVQANERTKIRTDFFCYNKYMWMNCHFRTIVSWVLCTHTHGFLIWTKSEKK